MSNVHNVSESDDINVIECIMNINKQLAELNSKVDKLNDVAKATKEANNKAETALDLAKQNEYEINDLKREVEGSKDSHNQWWIAIISAIAGGLAGIIGNFIH